MEGFPGVVIHIKTEEEFNILKKLLINKAAENSDIFWKRSLEKIKTEEDFCIRINNKQIRRGRIYLYDESQIITVRQAIERINTLWA